MLVLLLLWSWVSGCATLNPGPRRENFAPLFIYSEDEEREGKAADVLGPFFTYRKDTRDFHLAFRPFFYWQGEEEKYSRTEYLYPLGKYERTEREVKSYLMPFYSTSKDLTQGEKKERGFLLAFWGETEKGEPYGGFFPFYGNLKNRFGKDEINFFLWPVYMDSREGESRAQSVFWPFLTFYEGGGREGFKFWPLAAHVKKENSYEKSYFLWPIFHHEKRYLYTDDPTEINMVLPLYVSMTSSRRVQRSVLWPLFTYTYDEDDHYTQWDFPWPILQWAEGDDKEILRAFPLYGRKYWEGRERGYFLWPVYWYVREEDDQYKKSTERFLLLSKDETEVWKNRGQEERRIRVWPFFYYREDREGGIYFYWPCLIPLDYEGYERNWTPLFTLYEYRRTPGGDRESKFLWGVYVHRQNAVRELYELSFLFTLYNAEDVLYFSFLKGLVEYRARGTERALRLVYSPWPIEWETPRAPKEALAVPREERTLTP
ncbi:MAG: hypothetical protein NTX30_11630 [Deltaproteobacteria bacterium]|nr:hypothetical protein [Deltaproteobacteria bacterium]